MLASTSLCVSLSLHLSSLPVVDMVFHFCHFKLRALTTSSTAAPFTPSITARVYLLLNILHFVTVFNCIPSYCFSCMFYLLWWILDLLSSVNRNQSLVMWGYGWLMLDWQYFLCDPAHKKCEYFFTIVKRREDFFEDYWKVLVWVDLSCVANTVFKNLFFSGSRHIQPAQKILLSADSYHPNNSSLFARGILKVWLQKSENHNVSLGY